MKTKEELSALKNEAEHVSKKLSALTEEELEQVSGGLVPDFTNEPGLEPADVESSVIEPPVTTDRTAQ